MLVGPCGSAHTRQVEETFEILQVGEGPVAEALARMADALGWTTTSATTLAEVEAALPRTDAVVVTSHHEGVDGPAIRAALAHGTAYVGAMGSRKTQARRRDWLLGHGVTEEALAALHAPIGLDIGADTPGEIAVSILAEVVAVRRAGGREGPAYCPGG